MSLKSDLASPARREKLKPRIAPYAHPLGTGVAVLYRRGASVRVWRSRIGKAELSIAPADDVGTTDPTAIPFAEVVRITLERAAEAREPEAAKARPVTVGEALDDYRARCAASKTARQMATIDGHLRTVPADIRARPVAAVSLPEWNRWASGLVTKDRTATTANKIVSTIRTACRASGEDGPWLKLQKFKARSSVRAVAWTAGEAARVMAEADSYCAALGRLVRAAILTGFRFGALQAMRCGDVLPNGLVDVRQDKTGPRTCHVSPQAHTFLASLIADRDRTAPLLVQRDGRLWEAHSYRHPFNVVVKRAKVDATSTFYACRHTAITLMLYAGVPMHSIAASVGTSGEMISSVYAKVLAGLEAGAFAAFDPGVGAERADACRCRADHGGRMMSEATDGSRKVTFHFASDDDGERLAWTTPPTFTEFELALNANRQLKALHVANRDALRVADAARAAADAEREAAARKGGREAAKKRAAKAEGETIVAIIRQVIDEAPHAATRDMQVMVNARAKSAGLEVDRTDRLRNRINRAKAKKLGRELS